MTEKSFLRETHQAAGAEKRRAKVLFASRFWY
jgi:hypothetical protein